MPIIIISIITIALAIWWCIDQKNEKVILEKSQRVKALLDLNQTIKYKSIQPIYTNHLSCGSKRQLEHLSLDDYLISQIDSNEELYRYIIEAVEYNRNLYNKYQNKVQSIKSVATEEYCKSFGFTLTKFLKYEERVFETRLLPEPKQDATIHCEATYTSPQGRNHYRREHYYSYSELKNVFNRAMELKAQRQTREYRIKIERAKMTDSLRYDILKRDNFRCQICGSTAQDGVKLHVDHIVPVSKGGLTVASNLRTLCDRCNLGKSDKM